MQKHKEAALYILLNFIQQKVFLGYSGDPKDFLELLFLLRDQCWMNECTGTRFAHTLWLCSVVLSYWNATKSQINMALETSFHLHTET